MSTIGAGTGLLNTVPWVQSAFYSFSNPIPSSPSLPICHNSVGFVIGLVLSGIVMGLLSSAVDSIIVCFAEAPNEFAESHPSLAQEMQTAWSAAWPEEFRGVAIVALGGGLGIV